MAGAAASPGPAASADHEPGMNILDRYIVGRILAMTALVMAVIIALAVLFSFIAEQGDTGTGHYDSLDALTEAGGLNSLFVEPAADVLSDSTSTQSLSITTRPAVITHSSFSV